MKFKSYLDECLDLILEIRINSKDSDIKRIGDTIWEFRYKDNEYKFAAQEMYLLSGVKGYNIEWGLLKDGKIITDLIGDTKNIIGIFSKVATIMYLFLNLKNPESFSMMANVRLARVYDTMWAKFRRESPFNEYFFSNRKEYSLPNGEKMFIYNYSKKFEDQLSESQLLEIINLVYNYEI